MLGRQIKNVPIYSTLSGSRRISIRTLRGWSGELVVAFSVMWTSVVMAQEFDAAAALTQAEEAREKIVRANVLLTDEDADEFWQLYKEFRANLGPVQYELVNVVVEYSNIHNDISDAQASRLFDQLLTLREQESAIKSRYLMEFRKLLSPRHAIRYAQIENKLDAAMQWDAAVSVPLIE